MGEGGGQVLRTSLALSLVTGAPFRIEHIRAGRPRPGLLRQHLTALDAAVRIGGAEVEGAAIGAVTITFRPSSVRPGRYALAVGTAGSTTLVLQTVLPALCTAGGPSTLVLEGGTHNPYAPPFDFLERAYLPLLGRMGPAVEARLVRPGFYPAGGGAFEVEVRPAVKLEPLELLERGAVRRTSARALVASLPREVGRRELDAIAARLGCGPDDLQLEEVRNSRGPGNVVLVEVESEHVTEVFTAFGERGVAAEVVGRQAADAARRYLGTGVPVGPYLSDQLLLPLAQAGGGRFRTVRLSRHTLTNIEVLRRFLEVDVGVTEAGEDVVEVRVGAA